MPNYTTSDIRNIAFVGHGAVGKTTLAEHILFEAGVVGRCGTVEDKNTTADFEVEEKEHGHSLSSAVLSFDHAGKRFNIIDTPGFPDFLGQAITALPAVEVAVIVVDATKGIQTVTRRMMKLAIERNLPRMIVVNKIDLPEADLEALVGQLKETFGDACTPINLPSAGRTRVVDVLDSDSGEVDFMSVAEAHTAIIDRVVEVDDELMEQYLETGEAPAGEKRHAAFEQALREGHLTPVCFVSAKQGVGVKELLHIFCNHCPSPEEGNPRPFKKNGEDWAPTPDPTKPACAHVFKVATDAFVGKLAFFRVHQGTIKANSQVLLNDGKKPIRIGHLLSVRGKEHTEADSAIAGDIVGVAKIEDIHLNGVLHDSPEYNDVHLEPIPTPRPMFGQGIIPKSRGDETKVGGAVHKLMDEDPTFVVERVAATHQTVARGLGELHMRVMIERMKNRFGVEVDTEPPRVAYRETISANAEGHHRHKKQTGGAGQFGEVYLRIEPLAMDHEVGFEFEDDTFGGSVPKQFMPAIEKGVRAVLEHGAVAGYPMSGVKVSVYDGKHHPVDSKEVAFVAAGKRAFIDAIKKARPVLLEPFVSIEVTAPSSYMGDLTSDIAGKRGRVQGTDMLAGDQCMITAVVPLSETLSYASQLKSMTAGQGSFTMDFSHEEQTPPNVQAEIVAAYKPKDEED